MTRKRTDWVISSNKDSAIKRKLEAVKALTSELETFRRNVEAFKIEQEVSEDKVTAWNIGVEDEIEKANNNLKRLEEWRIREKEKRA